jgi:hypothetical protein
MLIASYPVFQRALVSSRTLLDLSLVQTDVRKKKKKFILFDNLSFFLYL